MRIALLSAASSIHTVRWANALAERGHSVRLFSLFRHAAKAGSISPAVSVYYLSGGYLRALPAFRDGLSAFAPDVLNVHYATGYGTLARRSGFAPVLLSVWGSDVYDFPCQSPIHRHIVVRNLRAATAIASTSERMAARVRALCPHLPPLYITPFGVDTRVFAPVPQARETGEVVIGIVKALEPKYGVDILLRAFARVTAQIPGGIVRLKIYGGGSQRRALEQLAKRLGIAPHVGFYGPVPHERVPEVLHGLDIFCAPSVSDSESFGVAAVEALACGIPVVAGAVDGFQEVLRDRQTGFLVPPRDVGALSEAMMHLVGDPVLRQRMGSAGRADVQARFEWQSCVARMEQALQAARNARVSGRSTSVDTSTP
ncbi:glycosyltransferase [Ethanoligenens sp.]|uniref:glycosyltransferase n=1 Tax=Ethanoligenens sp. TaxID=2099655 RepID=UPI0039E7B359